MKKTIFAAFAAALFLTACNSKTTETAAGQAAPQEVGSSDIAYVIVDAVLTQSDLFKNEGLPLQEKTQKAQKSWEAREKNLQVEAAQLQEKYQRGLITTSDAQAQGQGIEQRAAAHRNSAQREAQTLDEQNYVFTNRAQDLLQRAVQAVNAERKYKMIVNASALLEADSTLNITTVVLEKVNELYAAEQKEPKKSDKK